MCRGGLIRCRESPKTGGPQKRKQKGTEMHQGAGPKKPPAGPKQAKSRFDRTLGEELFVQEFRSRRFVQNVAFKTSLGGTKLVCWDPVRFLKEWGRKEVLCSDSFVQNVWFQSFVPNVSFETLRSKRFVRSCRSKDSGTQALYNFYLGRLGERVQRSLCGVGEWARFWDSPLP